MTALIFINMLVLQFSRIIYVGRVVIVIWNRYENGSGIYDALKCLQALLNVISVMISEIL